MVHVVPTKKTGTVEEGEEEGKVEGDLGEEDTDSAGLVLPQVSGLIPRPDSQSGNQTTI